MQVREGQWSAGALVAHLASGPQLENSWEFSPVSARGSGVKAAVSEFANKAKARSRKPQQVDEGPPAAMDP